MSTDQPSPPDRRPEGLDATAEVARRAQLARLRAKVVTLEATLQCERRRRQHVIDRYEQLLDERARENGEDRSDGPAGDRGLVDRLLK